MQAAATSAVLVLSVIAVLVVVLALVLYVRKLRAYFAEDDPDGHERAHLRAPRTRLSHGRATKARR